MDLEKRKFYIDHKQYYKNGVKSEDYFELVFNKKSYWDSESYSHDKSVQLSKEDIPKLIEILQEAYDKGSIQ